MKFTLSWLKKHLETEASLQAIADKLTAIGLEVEGIQSRTDLAPFTIAEILEAEKHPAADRLHVCKVNDGKTILQVVCGAPNARKGLKTVLAHEGDVIPRSNEALKKGVIRGIESQGMMCSASELQTAEEADGIIELPADAPVGANFAAYAGLNDPVIEINLTPNRGDCAGVRGIARDLAAAGLGTLKPLTIAAHPGKAKPSVTIALDFPAEQKGDCPLFIGRVVRNVKNGPSPEWMQQALLSVGLRPLSALVDITNYLTIDCNRPFHVFDVDKLQGAVRLYPAKGGEKLAALNNKTYELLPDMTVIADDTGPISLAGLMGGATTGCDANTKNVLVETAYFSPVRVAKTGRALQLTSDARYRFERGVDPAFVVDGAELATQLVLDLCGTPQTVVEESFIAGSTEVEARHLTYKPAECRRRLGIEVAAVEQEEILSRLGFKIEKKGEVWDITIPTWRHDVSESADITEEIIRLKGLDQVPSTPLLRGNVVTEGALELPDRRAGTARRALASAGLLEAVTWSFMPGSLAALFRPADPSLKLQNPISADLDVMRPSILPNLLQAAARNKARGQKEIALFEVGNTYHSVLPEGQVAVAASLRAGESPRHWAAASRSADLFDAKADALAVLAALGAPVDSFQITADAPAYYHPGRSGAFRLGPQVFGYFGEIHPEVTAAAGYEGVVACAEIFIDKIPVPRTASLARPALKLEDLQPVLRDFAFLADRKVEAAQIVKAIKGADKKLIRAVEIFDVYEGDKIAADKKSVALSVTLQPEDKALIEADLEALSTKIAAAVLKATGAVLRS